MAEPVLVEVGRIARPHGLRGEVVVELITDRDERVAPGACLQSDAGPLVVVASRPEHGQHGRRGSGAGSRAAHERWVVGFEGHTDRDAAERLRGLTLRAEPLDDPDELWTHDLVGSEVVLRASGERVGTCTALVANPAADLLELDGGALVPVVFVVEQSTGRVVIDPPDGLFDL